MGFDIPNLHIDESSPEGRVVREIVDREGVTPEEAVRAALRRELGRDDSRKGADEPPSTIAHDLEPKDLIGLFSGPEDLPIFEEAMSFVREGREAEIESMRRNLP